MPGRVVDFGYGKKKRQPEKLPLYIFYTASVKTNIIPFGGIVSMFNFSLMDGFRPFLLFHCNF